MTILNRDDILNADDIHTITVEVPEWGGSVLVRPLTGEQRDAYEQSNIEQRKGGQTRLNLRNARARLVALCVVGEDGRALFSKADVDALGRKSAAALDRVYEAARDGSGLSEADLEESAEGFDEAPGDSSSFA